MKWKDSGRRKGWEVKGERPEETCANPGAYYTSDEVERYCRSGGMRKAQQTIAYRIIDLLELDLKSKILDIGCGPGFTTQIYKDEGYQVIGLDVLPDMLAQAEAKSLEVKEGDMRDLKDLFKPRQFDAVVSASALQWLKDPEDLKQVASGIYSLLKNSGKAAIQFYPKSELELNQVKKIFEKIGFQARIVIDGINNPKKRTIYLVLEKDQQYSESL